MPPAFSTDALDRALAKIGERRDAFIADCAGKRDNTLICKTFGRLTFEELDAARNYLWPRIAAFRSGAMASIERSLPVRDRE